LQQSESGGVIMAKISALFQVLALIALSLFSGALLFIAIAVVKFWQVVSCFTSKLHVLISETLAARGSIWKFE
jgi:hypothetical protein